MIRNVRTFLVEKVFYASLLQVEKSPTTPKRPKTIITISRQHGCYGAETAIQLQKLLGPGWVVFHREILEAIAKDSGVEKEYLSQFDEKSISWIEEIINGFYKPYVTDATYLTYLRKFLSSLRERGKVIIIGRGANFVLKEGFHVRLVGATETRIKNLMELNKYTRNEAESELNTADRQRANYIKRLFDSNIDDPLNYDLVVNTDQLTFNEVAQIIFQATRVSAIFK